MLPPTLTNTTTNIACEKSGIVVLAKDLIAHGHLSFVGSWLGASEDNCGKQDHEGSEASLLNLRVHGRFKIDSVVDGPVVGRSARWVEC